MPIFRYFRTYSLINYKSAALISHMLGGRGPYHILLNKHFLSFENARVELTQPL